MENPGNFLKNLGIGMEVEVNPQRDRTRQKRIAGKISKILTRGNEHSHGILVELDNGETGRVKKIISDKSSFQEKTPNIKTTQATKVEVEDLASLFANGENHFVEFKSSSLWSVSISNEQIQKSDSPELKKYGKNASKFIIAKSIAGFLNADGGHLLIGIKENKTTKEDEIIGIESEFFKLKDPCVDGYRRMITDQIIKKFFPADIFHHINNYLQIKFDEYKGKTLCHIHVKKSDIKVFVNYKNIGYFFVRIDATTREIRGEEMVNYCLKRFK